MLYNMICARIYKVINDVDDETYTGSTTLQLNERFSLHLCNSKKRNSPIARHIDDIGSEHFSIQLLEERNFKTKINLLKRELYYKNKFGTLNKNNPSQYLTLGKEAYFNLYRQTHKNRLKTYGKIWYEKNKTRILNDLKSKYDERKYECPICDIKRGTKQALKTHLLSQKHLKKTNELK